MFRDDLVLLLASSPRKATIHITKGCWETGGATISTPLRRTAPMSLICPDIHISSMVVDLFSYICFYEITRLAYVSRWPFSATVDRLTINDDEPNHAVLDFSDLGELHEIYLEQLITKLHQCSEHALAQGVDGGGALSQWYRPRYSTDRETALRHSYKFRHAHDGPGHQIRSDQCPHDSRDGNSIFAGAQIRAALEVTPPALHSLHFRWP
ncbi:hypothetical protein EVJ58_g7928 [Rhodofomes roseus]|uniref:Uncharacterized protein n=1 Tax=Rhodofomes roseus TaxID=34475 RepID=A0A4Y9Y2Y0_9APHY|nr:hypothetical protein EVJ58_g7928 [Rhodofomes roseus]